MPSAKYSCSGSPEEIFERQDGDGFDPEEGRGGAPFPQGRGAGGEGFHPCHEAVAVARQGLDKARVLRRVIQRLAQSANRVIQAVFMITERLPRPEDAVYLLARHYVIGALEEHHQNLQRLFLQVDLFVSGPQFSCVSIELKVSETDRVWKMGAHFHDYARTMGIF
ncbi:MAG: hypothetical protein WCD04_18060 [Terriglobia bacterium]